MTRDRDSNVHAVQRPVLPHQPNEVRGNASDDVVDDLFTPFPREYALAWLIASEIVSSRYLDSAIDVIPIHRPGRGWDHFLITRRVSCALLAEEASNAFGMIEVGPAGEGPRITDPDGRVLLALGQILRDDPEGAFTRATALFPAVGLVEGDHARCPHHRSPHYPTLYRVISGLITDVPGLRVARELHVDDQMIDGAYHPLFVQTAEQGVNYQYDWFALQHLTSEYPVFVRINGRQSLYRSERNTWVSPGTQLTRESADMIRRRLLSWIGLTDGQ
jgi:hypothetical protein